MAGRSKFLTLIIVVLFLGNLFFRNIEARPIINSPKVQLKTMDNVIIHNNGGPSSGGHGHKATTVGGKMEENKTGGPSSGGQGHQVISDEMLEENKKSGPSPGHGN
ncbi:hypothetical protein M9H77_32432 [Catharanthus roseus]|uniref:Uncharacterized protein n=1 Tax=Catharanthus roseus TaxID=4058 RepID=A0ACC0A4C7_CATRO|nr:hypothetical protein M9H77_32432 [Catharanthus roseus]